MSLISAAENQKYRTACAWEVAVCHDGSAWAPVMACVSGWFSLLLLCLEMKAS